MIIIPKHVSTLDGNGAIFYFNATNAIIRSFNLKVKLTSRTWDDGTKDFEITVPLKYESDFWRALEMLLINCDI